MNKFGIIFFSLLVLQSCSSLTILDNEPCNCSIDKDSALQIAFDNGYERGLDSIKATYVNDSIWRFECYLCDESNTQQSNIMDINCITGKFEPTTISSITVHEYIGSKPRVYPECQIVIEHEPILQLKVKPLLLTNFDSGRESNISISGKNKVVFSYGFRKIGIINIDGSEFKQICDESLYPQWVNNDVISYFKDFEHVYEFNIHTLEETRITTEADRYDVFSVSPNNKWLAYLKDKPPVIEYDSAGNTLTYTQTCTSPREVDLWIMDISNPNNQRKVNNVSADIYDMTWTENGDSLLFYNGNTKYFATILEKNRITCSQLDKLSDIKLTNYKKNKNGLFPIINDCKIASVDYNTRSVKNILINERSRYYECEFSNGREYLIYTKSDKKNGDSKIWILNLTQTATP